MPTIEVTEEQHDRLAELSARLEDEFVGAYGTVTLSETVEYLLDRQEEGDHSIDPASTPTERSTERADGDADGEAATGDADSDAGGDGDAAESGPEGGEDRLSAMMQLLDDHEAKWRETDADDGNYEVDLPDGDVAVVRTKDDVRATLFKEY
jgi:hypothetical protein